MSIHGYVLPEGRSPASTHDWAFHGRLDVINGNAFAATVNVAIAPPGTFYSYPVFVPAANQSLSYDLDGNLIADGMWSYAYDAENRLVRMTMDAAVAHEIIKGYGGDAPWLTIEFQYDAQHRRVGKHVLTSLTDPQQVSSPKEIVYKFEWSSWEKYLYDTGTFNLIASYRADPETGDYAFPGRSYAWGPDLSGTLAGAGGIGGLARKP